MTATLTRTTNPPASNTDEVLKRYPILTAHLICESLGYFSPRAAANAVLSHVRKQPNYCEWYISAAGFNEAAQVEFNARTIGRAFSHRRSHRGYMANYPSASLLVKRSASGAGEPLFGSWQ